MARTNSQPRSSCRGLAPLMWAGSLLGLAALLFAPRAAPPQTAPDGSHVDLRHRAFSRVPMHPGRAAGPGEPTLRFRFGPVGAIPGGVVLDADDRIYASSLDGRLYALDAGGRLRFTHALGAPAFGAPALLDDAVCVGTDLGLLTCLDLSGRPRWRVQLPAAIESAPLRGADGKLYVSAGERLWRVDPSSNEATPVLRADNKLLAPPRQDGDGRLLVAGHDHRIYALTPAGQLLWRVQTDTVFDAPVTLGPDRVVLAAGDHGQVYALRGEDGALLFQRQLDGHVRAPGLLHAGALWLQTHGPRPSLLALSPASGTVLVHVHFPLCDSPDQGSRAGAAVDRAGRLWLGGPDDALYAFGRRGELRYRAPLGGQVGGQPVVNREGWVIVGARDGYIYGVSAPGLGLGGSKLFLAE